MALDYSQLSDNDLEALANEDYSKLSDETLKALTDEEPGTRTPEEGTQGASPVGAAVAAYKIAQPVLHAAKSIATNPVVDTVGGALAAPYLLKKAGGYLAEGAGLKAPAEEKLAEFIGQNVARTGGTMGSFALPAALSAPYLMSAHEQAKIRANPTAPEYANNPYAMSVRSQGTQQPITQGQAGAINQRGAVHNMSTAGNPMPGTPGFAALQQQYGGVKPVAQPAPQPAPQPQQPPQPPTAMNFIQRMKQLADQYSPATNFLQS